MRSFDKGTLSMRDGVSAYNRPPEDSALLSEAWKEGEAAEGDSGGDVSLGGVVKGLGLAVALVAFSLVPVGKQDVSIPANDPTKMPITNFVKIETD